MENKHIQLATYERINVDSNRQEELVFQVPEVWFNNKVKLLWNLTHEQFFSEYTWDDSEIIYSMANAEGVLFNFENVITPEDEKVFSVQSYLVKFQLGSFDATVNIYHTDTTKLTKKEIIEEALSLADDSKIELEERDIYEIDTVEIIEAFSTNRPKYR